MSAKQYKNAEEMAEYLSLLAHPLRLLMVCLLLQQEMCAMEIIEELGTTKGNISQHLKLLLLKKMVSRRREGNRVYFQIADKKLARIIKTLKDCCCDSAKGQGAVL